mgnify:CR=1 FL=1
MENFGQKSEILVKQRNFGQTAKFWSNSEILIKQRKFRFKKSKFGPTIEMLAKTTAISIFNSDLTSVAFLTNVDFFMHSYFLRFAVLMNPDT